MKIAFIVHQYNRHIGHARYVAELASRFKKDHEVHVFASFWEEPDPDGIIFHKVPAWRWRTLTCVLTFILPATLMIGSKFDVVHAQGLCGFRHSVATAHFIQSKWIKRLKNQGKSLGSSTWIWKWIIGPLENFALGPFCSKRVIAISQSVRRDLSCEYQIKDNVELIYHGTDFDKFQINNVELYRAGIREKLGIKESSFCALFVGNLQKGAAAAIRALISAESVYLMIVSGSDATAEKALAIELGVENRVTWVPLSKNIERYFASADCFVFPTLYEPFGMVISEAMASGLPVITNREAGAAELIEHGVTGWLTEKPWDADQIAEGMRALANDPLLRKRMGEAARKAIEPFTWDRCATETMAVYDQVVSGKTAPTRFFEGHP